MDYRLYLEQCLRESMQVKYDMFKKISEIEKIADSIVRCYNNQGKVLTFGNGGSAADSMHIAGELSGKFKLDRKSLEAYSLASDPIKITAIGNDYGFENIFSRQIEGCAKKGDILIGISTSGKSLNVIKGFEKGKEIGTYNISFTGEGGGILKPLSDICLDVLSTDTPRIQESHEITYHLICDLVEKKMFG
jgi:D-sedoheptulose 7-phosphate isomerase